MNFNTAVFLACLKEITSWYISTWREQESSLEKVLDTPTKLFIYTETKVSPLFIYNLLLLFDNRFMLQYILVCYCTLLSSHCFYPVLLPPFKWDEWTYLSNHVIPSQRACTCERLCVLCVTYSGCWHSLILRENADAAFCFCPCCTSRRVFISTMVIAFSFYGPCISL